MVSFSIKNKWTLYGLLAIFTWVSLVFFVDAVSLYDRKQSYYEHQQYGAQAYYEQITNICRSIDCLSHQDFVDLFDQRFISEAHAPLITTDLALDRYIKTYAYALGYRLRPLVNKESLILFEGRLILPEVMNAYRLLRDDMAESGLRLHLVSSFRSIEDQREIFFNRFGFNDHELRYPLTEEQQQALEATLINTAPPGYSKHHTGYALDFACGDEYEVFTFSQTQCYQWMQENNFSNIARYGFLPSYPVGVNHLGPQPEAWEYVWLGEDFLSER
jgi:hypothetical protein